MNTTAACAVPAGLGAPELSWIQVTGPEHGVVRAIAPPDAIPVLLISTVGRSAVDAAALGVHVQSVQRSAAEACQAVQRERPRVVLIHLAEMPSSFWVLQLCQRLRAVAQRVPLLVWGPQIARWFFRGAADVGVRGCLAAPGTAELRSAIRIVARGGVILDGGPDDGWDYVPCGSLGDADIPQRLSPQQGSVLGLMAAGRSNKEIADQLGIDISTAKFHVRNVVLRLGATNRTDAVYRAARMQMC